MTTKFNSVWVSSAARTGSMWTTNVVREIFLSAHYDIFPKNQIQSDLEWLNLYKSEAEIDQNDKNRYVLKIHSGLPSVPNYSKIITNIRNPYDICASFHEFMKCDVGRAITNAKHIPLLINHYSKLDKEKKFLLRYEDIDEKPVDLIQRIAEFLGFPLDGVIAEALAYKYSRDNVKKMIANNEKALHTKVLAGEQVSNDEVVVTPGIDRVGSFDTETGYQSHHISERKTGEWRSAFSQTEIPRIIEALAETAEKLGYKSETF